MLQTEKKQTTPTTTLPGDNLTASRNGVFSVVTVNNKIDYKFSYSPFYFG